MARKEEYERIAAERLEAEKEASSIARRDFLQSSVQCIGFCLLGLVLMFFAFWVDDLQVGRAFLWGGMAVGYAGIAWTLLGAYRRGSQRGDW
jgi:hypothetical protein